MNDGTCEDRIGSYICRCASGYTGDLCQTAVIRVPNGTATPAKSTPTSLSTSNQENAGQQLKKNNAGIAAGAVIGGIFLIIIAVLVIVCLVKRHNKEATSSTNPRLDFDGPYDITVQGTNVEPTKPASKTEDIYHDIQEQDKEYLYAQVDKNKKIQGNSSSAAQEGWMDNTIYATSDDNGEVNQEPALYASVDKSKKNAGKDNNAESGWMDNSIYATSDDNKRTSTNNDGATEGWAENTIYSD
ncbi:uncharacterized protein [Amphiura filiformis]|uniref:uncharacterized protein n=1 Tax=Amphiura filiformis TaxID=82378 RepID=UPI003B2115A9